MSVAHYARCKALRPGFVLRYIASQAMTRKKKAASIRSRSGHEARISQRFAGGVPVNHDASKVEKKKKRNAESHVETKQPAASEVDDKNFSSHYLIKSEPNDYNIDDLASEPEQTTCWEGVRNARARNIIKAMKTGQKAFLYQSACKVPGVVGIVEIVKEAYPDDTQFDEKSKYYDSKSTTENPRWFMVDIKFVKKLKRVVTLEELKKFKGDELQKMQLFTTARLSVQNVTSDEWDFVLSLEDDRKDN